MRSSQRQTARARHRRLRGPYHPFFPTLILCKFTNRPFLPSPLCHHYLQFQSSNAPKFTDVSPSTKIATLIWLVRVSGQSVWINDISTDIGLPKAYRRQAGPSTHSHSILDREGVGSEQLYVSHSPTAVRAAVREVRQEVRSKIQHIVLLLTWEYQLREEYPTSRSPWEHDSRSSSKRPYAEIESHTHYRPAAYPPPRDANPPIFTDTKGKGRMTPSQSTAFRLDHLLESSPSESPQPAAEPPRPGPSYECAPFSYPPSRPANEPIFSGKLPPPPVIGRTTVAAIPQISVGTLGISVPALVIRCFSLLNFSNPLLYRGTDLGRFAEPDDFERSVMNPAVVGGSTSRSGYAPLAGPSSDPNPNVKRSRKLGPDSQRRKARGLFPNDNVPLA